MAVPPLLLALAVAVFSTMGSSGSYLQVGLVVGGVLLGIALYYVTPIRSSVHRK